MTPEDDAAFREFSRILRTYLSPASIAEAMQDTIDYIEGRPGAGGYWDRRPGEEVPRLPPMDDNQRGPGLRPPGLRHRRPPGRGKLDDRHRQSEGRCRRTARAS